MGVMSEIDIGVRNYIHEYRQDSYETRATKRREAAIEAYTWKEISDGIKIADSEDYDLILLPIKKPKDEEDAL